MCPSVNIVCVREKIEKVLHAFSIPMIRQFSAYAGNKTEALNHYSEFYIIIYTKYVLVHIGM